MERKERVGRVPEYTPKGVEYPTTLGQHERQVVEGIRNEFKLYYERAEKYEPPNYVNMVLTDDKGNTTDLRIPNKEVLKLGKALYELIKSFNIECNLIVTHKDNEKEKEL